MSEIKPGTHPDVKTMTAVVLTAYGDVDKLELRQVPEPSVGPGEIKVRVSATSINPIDWKQRSGQAKDRMPLTLPAILGRDAAGVIVEIGAGVTYFHVGMRVIGVVKSGYAEYAVADQSAWAEVPQGMDLDAAAELPLISVTGSQLITHAVKPKKDDIVLVTGAAGSVGRVAVFTAKQLGVTVWAGIRADQRAQADSLGADGVVALDDADDLAKLPMVNAIADTVGGELITKLFDKLKAGGTIGSVVGPAPGAEERNFVVRAIMSHPDGKRLAEAANAVAAGKLTIPIAKTMALADVREAQTLGEKGVAGKIVLHVAN